MTVNELQEKGAIYFEKITDGFAAYSDVKMVLDGKKAMAHFKNLCKEYGMKNAYADFYYFRLDDDAREMADELLTAEEKTYLQFLMPEGDVEEEIIFPLDEKLLKIIVKLNAEEMLFSTIYFVQGPGAQRARTTWWGNYEHEYICFRDKV